MSQERSYFFDPNTSGAEKRGGLKKLSRKLSYYILVSRKFEHYERGLTNIVGCVTRRFQGVPGSRFLRKPKVCQFQCRLLSWKENNMQLIMSKL